MGDTTVAWQHSTDRAYSRSVRFALSNAPEALPCLIAWTKDEDADVHAEAKKAITAMHQSGGTPQLSQKK